MPAKPVPEGFHTVTPYLVVKDASSLLPFLEKAFGGEIVECHRRPDGAVMHGEVRIGDSIVMLGEAQPTFGAMPAMLYLYVPDADAFYDRAVAAGAVSIAKMTDQFYGDRVGGVKDTHGNQWWIATHKEDVTPEEMARRAAAAGKPC